MAVKPVISRVVLTTNRRWCHVFEVNGGGGDDVVVGDDDDVLLFVAALLRCVIICQSQPL